MIKTVLLNRLTDGLILSQVDESYNDEKILSIKHSIKNYHKTITSFTKDTQSNIKQIEDNNYGIYYKISSYVVFTIIVEKGYPLKLTNAFLQAIIMSFFDQAKCLFGAENLRSRLQSIQGSHPFVKFDRVIKQKKKQFDNPNSLKNTQRLKKELQSIQDIIKQNMGMLDKRHNELLRTEQKAKKIKQEAQSFHSGTKKLVWHLWIRKNLIWVVIALLIIVFYFCIL